MKPEYIILLATLGAVLGAAALVYGLWLAWHPLGFIVAGLIVAAASVFAAYDETKKQARGARR